MPVRTADLHGTDVDPLLPRAAGRREDADISRATAAAGGGAACGLDGVDGDGDDLPHARLRVRLHGLLGQIFVLGTRFDAPISTLKCVPAKHVYNLNSPYVMIMKQ